VAQIVAAMAMTHSPGLTGWFDRASVEYQQLALSATAEMRRRLEAARPDTLVMLSNDHLLNWPINNIPDYTVGIGDEHVGPAGAVTHTPTAMLDPRTPGSTGRGQKTKTRQHQPVKSRR